MSNTNKKILAILLHYWKRCWCRTYPARSWRLWCHVWLYSTKLVQEIQVRSYQPSRGTTTRKAICCRPWDPLSKNWGQSRYKYTAIVTRAWSFRMDYRASSSSIREDKQKMQRSAPRFDNKTSRRACENLHKTLSITGLKILLYRMSYYIDILLRNNPLLISFSKVLFIYYLII